jgi:carboxylesterase type B
VPDLKNTLGAFHVSELFFVFGNEDGRRCSIVSRKCLEYLMTSPWFLTENVYLSNKNARDIREINGDYPLVI